MQKRRSLYAALEGPTCLAEAFQEGRVIHRVRANPWRVGFRLSAPASPLGLTGTWPTAAGASMAINTGSRPRVKPWTRANYEAHPGIVGLYYPSSMHANNLAVALYERAESFLEEPTFHAPLTHPELLTSLHNAALDLRYGLV
jgi:hypothetical protein